MMLGPYSRDDKAYCDETDIISDYLSTIIQSGVMLDVGAHHGSSAAHFLQKGWYVYGFEPDPDNRKKLVKNFSKNSRLKIFDSAVSNKAGEELPFYASKVSTGISGLNAFHENHEKVCIVTTTTLSHICEQENIEQVDFLKIDTEGHDLMVLQGFPWSKMTPAVIECEFEDKKTKLLNYDFYDLAGFLLDKGYHIYVSEWYPIIKYGIRHDWMQLKRYPCSLSDDTAWGNLIAFRDKPDEEEFLSSFKKLIVLGEQKLGLVLRLVRKIKRMIKQIKV